MATLKKLVQENKSDEVILNYIEENYEAPVDNMRGQYNQFLATFNTLFEKNHRYTDKMAKKLKTRLKTFTMDEVLRAVENLAQSEWHRGSNERGWVADPEFILRDDAQLDKWINVNPVQKAKDFEEPSKLLNIELMLYLQLKTGGEEGKVVSKYPGFVAWMRDKNQLIDFDKTKDRFTSWLLKDGVETNMINDQSNLLDYEKYIRTMKENSLTPRPEIVELGELLKEKLS